MRRLFLLSGVVFALLTGCSQFREADADVELNAQRLDSCTYRGGVYTSYIPRDIYTEILARCEVTTPNGYVQYYTQLERSTTETGPWKVIARGQYRAIPARSRVIEFTQKALWGIDCSTIRGWYRGKMYVEFDDFDLGIVSRTHYYTPKRYYSSTSAACR